MLSVSTLNGDAFGFNNDIEVVYSVALKVAIIINNNSKHLFTATVTIMLEGDYDIRKYRTTSLRRFVPLADLTILAV